MGLFEEAGAGRVFCTEGPDDVTDDEISILTGASALLDISSRTGFERQPDDVTL
jgi:hypothetical protein